MRPCSAEGFATLYCLARNLKAIPVPCLARSEVFERTYNLLVRAEVKRVLRPGGKYLFIEHVAAPGKKVPSPKAFTCLRSFSTWFIHSCGERVVTSQTCKANETWRPSVRCLEGPAEFAQPLQ